MTVGSFFSFIFLGCLHQQPRTVTLSIQKSAAKNCVAADSEIDSQEL
jgi:hypothetical protein